SCFLLACNRRTNSSLWINEIVCGFQYFVLFARIGWESNSGKPCCSGRHGREELLPACRCHNKGRNKISRADSWRSLRLDDQRSGRIQPGASVEGGGIP